MPFADMHPDLDANRRRFAGFADIYDAWRPRPPEALAGLLCGLASVERPRLVVDLGSGTGTSSRYWAGRAMKVIGVEPSADMRRQAEAATNAAHVIYREGWSHETGLPDDCADIVTCSQSLHWMLADPTFAEVARILRPNGVFASYDYDWPPLMTTWRSEDAYHRAMAAIRRLEREYRLREELVVADKAGHLSRMQDSGRFRHVREFALHMADEGGAGRLVGLILSLGTVQALKKTGLSEAQLGIDALRDELAELGMPEREPWYWTFRVRIGIV